MAGRKIGNELVALSSAAIFAVYLVGSVRTEPYRFHLARTLENRQSSVGVVSDHKDGTFYGWGYSPHGDIEAYVRIQNGQITEAGIERCLTRYPCSRIQQLPGQVRQRQSAEVDYVSGATQSAVAFYDAVSQALSKAK
jgi:uncharacterized protein with FMN-binding domain